MNNPAPAQSTRSDVETTMNITMYVIHVYATAAELALHAALGERYFGFNTLAVVFAMGFHVYLFKGYNVILLMKMIPCYLALLLVQRVVAREATRNGIIRHSYYNGVPIFLKKSWRISEITFKCWIEPFCVAAFGLLFMTLDPPTGSFVLACGVALRVKTAMTSKLHRSRLLDIQDGSIEQQIRAEHFRQMPNSHNTIPRRRGG